jgi:hypothetical protein
MLSNIDESCEGRRFFSVDVDDDWLAKLSTLRRPFAFMKIPVFSAVAVLGDETLVIIKFDGTAALPMVVRKASRGVDSLSRPETCVNFWMARTNAR